MEPHHHRSGTDRVGPSLLRCMSPWRNIDFTRLFSQLVPNRPISFQWVAKIFPTDTAASNATGRPFQTCLLHVRGSRERSPHTREVVGSIPTAPTTRDACQQVLAQ